MDASAGCFICRKHAGMEEQPPGGYLIEEQGWRVCHAPARMGAAGTLVVELERHALGLADLTPDEAAALGPLLRRVSAALAAVTGAERDLYADDGGGRSARAPVAGSQSSGRN